MVQPQKRRQHGRRPSRFPRPEKGTSLSLSLSPTPPLIPRNQPTNLGPQTKRILIPTRLNSTINRLQKTRTEIPPPHSTTHLQEERDAHLATKRQEQNTESQKRRKEEARMLRERKEEKERRDRDWEKLYGQGRVETEGVLNQEGWDEDDFM